MLCTLVTLVVVLVLVYQAVCWLLTQLKVGDYGNKYVLVTGCGSGFGYHLVRRLDDMGFHVFATCHTSASVEKLQAVCSDHVTAFVLDVADENSILEARDFVEKNLPSGVGLWAVVNNAGIAGPIAPSEWVTHQGFLSYLNVNLFGLIDVTRIFLPLVRRSKGRVVNMTSVMGRIALTSIAPYAVSKFGAEAYSDCLRREVRAQGIKVCIIEPGFFKSNMVSAARWVSMFTAQYEATPPDTRQLYPSYTPEKFTRRAESRMAKVCDSCDAVTDAYVIALTSVFPPTRQVVGTDARLLFRLLWNLPC